jgi:hypothetical protein
MRYWKFKGSNRLLITYCQMSSRWEEITEELYNKLKLAEKERRVAFLQIEEFSSDQSIDA